MKNKITLITGAAGFIGFHTSIHLLKKGKKVIGIDNLNNYYLPQIKKDRLKILSKFDNFTFYKIDIINLKKLEKIFDKLNIETIINLAAQAGVAYSLINPKKYFLTNSLGFFNICLLAKKYNVKKILFASSSSVYGDNQKLPVKEKYELNPLSYYAITKQNNEQTAKFFSTISKTKYIGLRFFSVYGLYGRPDMIIYKLISSFKKKETFYVNNFGEHKRDFTHVDDVIKIMDKLLIKNLKNNYDIFNICSSKPVSLKKIIQIFQKNKILPKLKFRG
ncbi:NAD-dependent epimerase/dehydratase family protein, partial [Candidatus Pelagibacter sp.]|nr:NAD-dependent epimerase/dehydratase family protein [Candidatus Pelagibacter sp.]